MSILSDIFQITTATVAGAAIGYLVFAVQELHASDQRVWQALADTPPAPALVVTDEFIKNFQPGKLEEAMKKKYGAGFDGKK